MSVDKITETHVDKNIVSIDADKKEVSKQDLIKIAISLRDLNFSNNEIELFITQNMGIEMNELVKEEILQKKY